MAAIDDRPAKYHALIAVAWLLVLTGATIFLAWWTWPSGSGLKPAEPPRPIAARGELAKLEETNIAIYAQASPAVVHVTNLLEQLSGFNLNLQQIPAGTGSGFIWDREGHVVTNHHVVEGADAAKVILADHSSYNARKIWAYPDKDIAVLWIDAPPSKLQPISIGTSHNLKVGQFAYAIGNPFGLDQTMTEGIVSALGREIQSVTGRPIHGVIQTSAAINPGNSGGPLLDSAGRLIGMNTSIISPSGAFAGIGFAIPVDEINQIVPQLIHTGKIVRPTLGVQFAEGQLAEQLGVSDGALIINVTPKSPAALAGLRGTRRDRDGNIVLGDVIVAVDDQPVSTAQDVFAVVDNHKVGDTITLTILRDEQRRQVKLTLQPRE